MALKSTTKIRLFVSSEQEKEVLSFLQENEVMEITSSRKEQRKDVSHDAEFSVSKLDLAIKYLSSFVEKKPGLRNTVLGEKIEVSEVEVNSVLSSFDWNTIVEKVTNLEIKSTDTLRELSEVKNQLVPFSVFENCEILNLLGRFSPLFFSAPTRNIEKIQEEILKISKELDLSIVEKGERVTAFVVFAEDKVLMEVRSILVKLSGSEVSVAEGLSPKKIVLELKKNKKKLEDILSGIEKESKKLAESLNSLKIVYDKFASESAIEYTLRMIEVGSFVSIIEGWVIASELNNIESSLSKKYNKAIAIEIIEKSEGEVERVVLNPSNLIAPIMEVTKMFGTPKIEEVDPTPYYAFFFLVFFGFCLTDAGYGLILIAMTSFALSLNLPLEKSVINMIRMFMYGGVSTVVMGALFGGWFGLTPDQVPEIFTYMADDGKRMFLGQIFDPMTDLVSKIMPLAYILGVIHLSLGLYLSGLIAWKAGDKNRMLFVTIPMILMFIFASLTWVAGIESLRYAFYASLITAMWGLGGSGNPVIRMLKGVGSLLNESLGWFSNILSYSRLFALGLATGIIAMSFNIVAMTMGSMVPGVGGWVVIFIVLAFGHTLNIALNVLGAYVHSSRLQFVEFFGMFLEGGGKILKPLRKVCRFRHTS
ncbi:TPA: hypothetical protein EYG84_01255 [Candidatus Gracilibacteria bacterium]|nr:hypothetical protein [Candidatus Gracilibacteria bacterium]